MATMYPTYDYETEQSDIARRQKVADAMLGGALSPIDLPQQTGPVASRVSPLAIIAKIAQAKFAGDSSEALKKEKAALGERYKSDLSSGVEEYLKNLEGYEAPSYPGEGAPMEKVAGDPRRAAVNALASNHPVLQALGLKQMEKLTTAQKRKIKEVSGMLYDEDTLETVALGGPKPTQKVSGGDLYEQNPSTGQWKKLDNAPKISTNVSMSPVIGGQKAGMEAYWKGAAEQVQKLGGAANQANENLPKINRLEALNNSGVISNVTTNPATYLTNLAQAAGVKVDTTKLKNTEEFNAESMRIWVDMIKESGGARGWTEAETKKIQQALPSLSSSPQARSELITLMQEKAKRDIVAYQSANKSFAKAAKLDDPELFADEFKDIFVSPVPHTPSAVAPPQAGKKVIKWGDLP